MHQQTFEQRCAIKFCVKLVKSATVTYEKLQRAYGENYLSRAQVPFKRPRTSERRTSPGKNYNLKNKNKVERVRCLVRSSFDIENDQ